MLRRIINLFSRSRAGLSPKDLLSLEPSLVSSMIETHDGLPHVDWGMADLWIARQSADIVEQQRLKRAVAGAWLDSLRDSLKTDHKRWRHRLVEGLAPCEDNVAARIARAADRSAEEIAKALLPITATRDLAPIAVVAFDSTDDYYSYVAPLYPDEGEFATSGGLYLRSDNGSWPEIVFPTQGGKHALENIIAHEMTHHALAACNIPLWAEEGLTQMMEERVTGVPNFIFNREMLERHQSRWLDDGDVDDFLSGDAFHSANNDDQELAYHLSQIVVRSLLTREPQRFFQFARACTRQEPETAATQHLGRTPGELVEQALQHR